MEARNVTSNLIESNVKRIKFSLLTFFQRKFKAIKKLSMSVALLIVSFGFINSV